jgi:hypothetical protein
MLLIDNYFDYFDLRIAWLTFEDLKAASTTCSFSSLQMDLGLLGIVRSLTEPVASKRLIRLVTVSRFIDL